jgi:hypothetical protein
VAEEEEDLEITALRQELMKEIESVRPRLRSAARMPE